MPAEISEEQLLDPKFLNKAKTAWIKFGNLTDTLHFVGRDTVAIICGLHILFYDLSTNSDLIYKASSPENGSGVQCMASYKVTSIFAFAEKCLNPRIFVKDYPSFTTITKIKDKKGYQYLALAFAEVDYLITLGSLPDYEIAVWNWKTGEKLTCEKTGVISLHQIFKCSSGATPVVAQMDLNTLNIVLWEVHSCCKNCLLSRQDFVVPGGTPPCRFNWSPDGAVLIMDAEGSVYMIEGEKRRIQHIFDWTGDNKNLIPAISWHKGGIIVSGPDGTIKHFKRVSSSEWEVIWSVIPEEHLITLATTFGRDYVVILTTLGSLMQFKLDDQGPRFIEIAYYGKNFIDMCFINPLGKYFATLDSRGCINTWDVDTGAKVGEMLLGQKYLIMVSSPIHPYLALGRDDGIVDFINVFKPEKPKMLAQVNICHDGISGIEISLPGNYVVPCVKEKGLFFAIKSDPGNKMDLKTYIDMQKNICNYMVYELKSEIKVVALTTTRVCCASGDKLHVYTMKFKNPEFFEECVINLPGLYSYFCVKPSTSSECYGIPHLSRQLHILNISYENHVLELIDAIATGHQVRRYNMTVTDHNILTYGLDGVAVVRDLENHKIIGAVAAHHYTNHGIKKALVHPLGAYVLTIGQGGTMTCSALDIERDPVKSKSLMEAWSQPHLSTSFTTRKTLGFMSSTGLKEKTWFELQDEIKVMQETAQWGREKLKILEQFSGIQRECVDLLMKNYESEPEEQLPVEAFDLDDATRAKRTEETQIICTETETHMKALIFVQNKLCETLKKRFWDTVEVKGRKLKAIMGKGEVESYPIYSPDFAFEEELNWVKERRNLEILMLADDNFKPWEAAPIETDSHQQRESFKMSGINIRKLAIASHTSVEEMKEEEEEKMKIALSGSTSHEFIKLSSCHHSQFELTNYMQLRTEIMLLMQVVSDLRQYFNEKFNEVFSIKEREMVMVAERNARLRYILSEMNIMDNMDEIKTKILQKNYEEIAVMDPEWGQEEQPERIMKVADKEVQITPYVSPSRQEILDKLAAEAEALRLALLADNFRELALIVMMDGVLEVRWEDEIKKDIVKPKCMLEKNPADFNEEDLKIIREYEEKVQSRLSERDKYRKMLGAEFHKLSQTLKESVLKFNSRLGDLFLLKLKVEAAKGQENLKIIRAKSMVQKLAILNEKIISLKNDIKKKEASNTDLHDKIQQLQNWTSDCRGVYDSLLARDKHLEKNFKKEFPEVSQVVMEQLIKFYKRRPKMHQRAQMSVSLLNELSRCIMSTDIPPFLPPEYLDFLKGLEQIDYYYNSPPIINEEIWNIMCRVRRQKVECELKVRCSALEVAESEQTLSIYQKRYTSEKQNLAALNDELRRTREQILELQHNSEIQLVMKGGFVEVPTTGSLSDFKDAILITRSQVESINELVRKAGKQKLAAMHRVSSFRRGILAKEWEHRKLKMEIEDLEDHLHNLDSIKVTRDIQMFLLRRAKGTTEDRVILSIEKELQLMRESYESMIKDLQEKMDELDKKIIMQNKANRQLDDKIIELNVDVSEQQLQRDMEYEVRLSEAAKKRMVTIVKRSQLVAFIQKQHSEILALQTELELLRLKTYPTLKFKTLI